MTCLVCSRRAQMFLCPHCTKRADRYLDSLPWLVTQLNVTVGRQDRLTTSSVGRSGNTPPPINFDAVETAAKLNKTLVDTVRTLLLTGEHMRPARTVPTWFIGPLLPGWQRTLYVPTTADYIAWLRINRHRIPKSPFAADIVADLANLVDEDNGQGALVVAINRNERRYFGPCSHVKNRDRHGQPVECGADIYGPRDAAMVTCPECGVTVSASTQLDQTKNRTDLKTMDMLIDTMRALGETVGRNRVQAWINSGRLERRGFYNQDHGITKKRRRRGDPAVYSLAQARDLWAHQTRQQQRADAR